VDPGRDGWTRGRGDNAGVEQLSFTEAELPGLCDRVAAADPDLRRVIAEFGYPPYWQRPNTFESLVWFVLEQQVSLASARAALEKLRDRVGRIVPERVLELTDEELRAAYFSRQKTGYVRGIAQEILDGHLDLAALTDLPAEAIRRELTRLKGVGNWTVDVYLVLVLHRRDVFPVGDLAAVNGVRALKGLPRTTPATQVAEVAAAWAPLRTVGTILVWHDYLSRRAPGRRAG
jgi:DNA-3-methyladenine glycosylase II